jgi:uncharacterized protein
VIAYLDTSAALRALVIGPGPQAARVTRRTQRYLDQLVEQQHVIVSSALMRTEILCQANRRPEIEPGQVTEFLSLVNLVGLDTSDLDDAPNTPGRLRTLDAIHLTVALRIGADVMVAYDHELCRAAQAAGLRTGPP